MKNTSEIPFNPVNNLQNRMYPGGSRYKDMELLSHTRHICKKSTSIEKSMSPTGLSSIYKPPCNDGFITRNLQSVSLSESTCTSPSGKQEIQAAQSSNLFHIPDFPRVAARLSLNTLEIPLQKRSVINNIYKVQDTNYERKGNIMNRTSDCNNPEQHAEQFKETNQNIIKQNQNSSQNVGIINQANFCSSNLIIFTKTSSPAMNNKKHKQSDSNIQVQSVNHMPLKNEIIQNSTHQFRSSFNSISLDKKANNPFKKSQIFHIDSTQHENIITNDEFNLPKKKQFPQIIPNYSPSYNSSIQIHENSPKNLQLSPRYPNKSSFNILFSQADQIESPRKLQIGDNTGKNSMYKHKSFSFSTVNSQKLANLMNQSTFKKQDIADQEEKRQIWREQQQWSPGGQWVNQEASRKANVGQDYFFNYNSKDFREFTQPKQLSKVHKKCSFFINSTEQANHFQTTQTVASASTISPLPVQHPFLSSQIINTDKNSKKSIDAIPSKTETMMVATLAGFTVSKMTDQLQSKSSSKNTSILSKYKTTSTQPRFEHRKSVNFLFNKEQIHTESPQGNEILFSKKLDKAPLIWDGQSNKIYSPEQLYATQPTLIAKKSLSLPKFEQKILLSEKQTQILLEKKKELLQYISAGAKSAKRQLIPEIYQQSNMQEDDFNILTIDQEVKQDILQELSQPQDEHDGSQKQQDNQPIFNEKNSEKNNHWEDREGLWENVSREALEILKGSENAAQIFQQNQLSIQMLCLLLRQIYDSNAQDKYLLASMKIQGWNPFSSTQFCEIICNVLQQNFNVDQQAIMKFSRLYYEYHRDKWEFSDYFGNKGKIKEICSYFFQLTHRDTEFQNAMRLLGFTENLAAECLWEIVIQENLKFKQYFRVFREFMSGIKRLRVTNTKFFKAVHIYLKGAMNKLNIDSVRQNRIYYLLEQFRHLIVLPRQEDCILVENQEIQQQQEDESLQAKQQFVGSNFNLKEKKKTNSIQAILSQNGMKNNNQNQERKTNTTLVNNLSLKQKPLDEQESVLINMAIDIEGELMDSVKIKLAFVRLQKKGKHNLPLYMYLTELVLIFCLNDYEHCSYGDVLTQEKLGGVIRMCEEFISYFQRALISQLSKLKVSNYFIKDTQCRLEYVKVFLKRQQILIRVKGDIVNLKSKSETVYRSLNGNFSKNYLLGCYYLWECVNMEEFLVNLCGQYEKWSENNRQSILGKGKKVATELQLILNYSFPSPQFNQINNRQSKNIGDLGEKEQLIPQFISAYDFQAYIFSHKLEKQFFSVIEELLQRSLDSLYPQLTNVLVTQFRQSLSIMVLYDQKNQEQTLIDKIQNSSKQVDSKNTEGSKNNNATAQFETQRQYLDEESNEF